MSTGATPYMLVYGTEAVIPTEVEVPSLKIIQEAELSDTEWVRNCYEQLALKDGKRINVVCHGHLYRNRMSRAFNKRVKQRQFAPGLLVLKKIFPHQDKANGKFPPNWQGITQGNSKRPPERSKGRPADRRMDKPPFTKLTNFL
ncbi:uncharacterized protein [Nicotiana sylvestris]|uniref:uncharacterized protein n=1 Tax=Nicotiana sylvestris TaxID=4096 RepID=UPI00388C72A9